MLAVERNVTPNTRAAYHTDLINFIRFFLPSQVRSIVQIFTEENLRTYCASLAHSKKSTATICRKISTLKQYGAFLVREGQLAMDPTQLLEMPKKEKHLPRVVSEDDLRSLFSAVAFLKTKEQMRALLMLSLLYGSGLRVSELVGLQWGHIESSGTFLRILGKGRRERRVPLCSRSLQLLKEWRSLSDTRWIFPSSKKGTHLTRQRIFQILREIAHQAGLGFFCLSPHVLRHAFATHLLERGVDLISIKKMLGHRDVATTEIYTHVQPEHLTQTVLKHHPLACKKEIFSQES
ncbi:MAG: tyrosine-type recombinase/integrase [Holosporales bacterium]|nr:tyrosine-type recombinase/integrase [Holosporales bacterium]